MLKASLAQLKAADALVERCMEINYTATEEKNKIEKVAQNLFFWILHQMNERAIFVSDMGKNHMDEIEMKFEFEVTEFSFKLMDATYAGSSNFVVLKGILNLSELKRVRERLKDTFNQLPNYKAWTYMQKGENLEGLKVRLELL